MSLTLLDGSVASFDVREMTIGEIRRKVPDLDLLAGMLPEAQRELLDRLPFSEFRKLVDAVVELTYGTKKSEGN
jgi:hypothetical protein